MGFHSMKIAASQLLTTQAGCLGERAGSCHQVEEEGVILPAGLPASGRGECPVASSWPEESHPLLHKKPAITLKTLSKTGHTVVFQMKHLHLNSWFES